MAALLVPKAVLGLTVIVDSTANTPSVSPYVCDDGTGHCTLAAAAAVNPCGDTTVVLAVTGTINGDVAFNNGIGPDGNPCSANLWIIGPGSDAVTVAGNLNVQAATTTISDITVNGSVSAGILAYQLSLMNVVDSGGGVTFNGGSPPFVGQVDIVNSRIENSVGIGVNATTLAVVSLTNSIVSHSGGAGLSTGSVSLSGSRIEYSFGPGIEAQGSYGDRLSADITLKDSAIIGNAGDGMEGARDSGGTLELIRSTIAGNGSAGVTIGGGPLTGAFASASVTDSTINSNGGPGFATDGDTSITRSTISGNTGGGINVDACDGDGMLTVAESTISENSTPGSGGGILFRAFGPMELDHDTIVNNRADSDGDGVGAGGGVSAATCGILGGGTISHSLLTGNSDGAGAPDCAITQSYVGASLPVVTADSNLIGSPAGGCSVGADNLIGVNPQIGPLADNGGLTQTHALLAGSPAIDAAGSCSGTDQRGVSQPQGAACDIGAYEFACGNGTVDLGEQCDDGNLNGGTDCCSANCQFVSAGTSCPDDGEPCTADTCDGTGVCTHVVPVERGCVAASLGGSTVSLKDDGVPAHNQFTWNWKTASPVAAGDFGNPVTSTGLVLCTFERDADAPTLLLSATAPAAGLCKGRPCWTSHGTGFSYRDPELTPDGLLQLSLKPAAKGAHVTLKGKGAHLALPTPPLIAPLTVRLQRSDSLACWEAVFSKTLRNDSVMFKAKSD